MTNSANIFWSPYFIVIGEMSIQIISFNLLWLCIISVFLSVYFGYVGFLI